MHCQTRTQTQVSGNRMAKLGKLCQEEGWPNDTNMTYTKSGKHKAYIHTQTDDIKQHIQGTHTRMHNYYHKNTMTRNEIGKK